MAAQRKTVSVVFADLVESTALAERLDPEVLASVLGRYFETLRKTIEAHGGTVEKFIGDAVVGVFGIPTLHEDDALRAVRAALEMHEAVAKLNEELRPTLGIELAIRVGVNTGEVIASADNAMGHAVSMAARLEQSAQAREVLIGRRTYDLVSASVDVQAVDNLVVKGSTDPLAAWRVTGARDLGPRAPRAGTRYVGRERELAAIAKAYESAVRAPSCAVVTILAPPGLGKSRLIAEATKLLEGSGRVVGGACLPYGEGITYAPLVQVVRQLEAESGPGFIGRLLADQAEGEQVVARVQATVDGAASGSPDETAWAFRRLFEALALERPLVLVLDDLHWADSLLLDLAEYIATFSIGAPILQLCAARPDILETRPSWSQTRPDSIVLRLAPLSSEETAVLLEGLQADNMDSETRSRILDASGGVPLFVEQMAAFDDQVEGHGMVPPTIRALLSARIDHLSADERAILERAAIEGQIFHRDTVGQLMPDQTRNALGAQLMSLARREFIRPQPSANGRDAFAFNHALVRDAVYEAMPRRTRAELHERVAGLLETRSTPRDLIGFHLEQAYRERVAVAETGADVIELARRAGLALAVAGREATARKEAARAAGLLVRAADLLTADPSLRATVLPDLIDGYVTDGNLEASDAIHLEAVELARSLGDVTSELRAELAWTMSEVWRGKPGWRDRALDVTDRAVEHFRALGDDSAMAQALLLKGLALPLSDQLKAIEAFKEAQVCAERTSDERIQVEIWDELGGAMLFGPTPYPETLEFTRRKVAWAREHGIAFTVADGRLGEAYALAALAQFDGAIAALDELKTFFAQLPSSVSQEGECYVLAGRVERDRGNPKAAEREYRRAMELFEETSHERWWRNAAPGVAHALLDMDRVEEARGVLDEIRARAVDGDGAAGAFRLEAEARYLVRLGDVAGGVEMARQAVAGVANTGAPQYEGRARETLARVLKAAGDATSAAAEYAIARSLYAAKGYLPGVARIDRLTS